MTLERLAAAVLEEVPLARGVELQERRAELETLRPFRPAARGVDAPRR